MNRRAITSVVTSAAVALLLSACAASGPRPDPAVSTPASPAATDAPTPTADAGDLVELESGHRVYLECRGTGTPMVLFISGGGVAADEWSTLAPGATEVPVMDAIAETNRVCAYDRPGTTRVTGEPSRSDPVDLPRTLSAMSEELVHVLRTAGESGPWVIVAHSFGSAIGREYAGTHPEDVAGLVWVDGGHETFYSAFQELVGPEGYDVPGVEYDLPTTLAEMRDSFAAHPLPIVPSAVIEHSRDRDTVPNPMGWNPSWPIGELEVAWGEAQDDLVALVPGTVRVVAEHSGHLIMVEQVDLVIDAIRDVLHQVS